MPMAPGWRASRKGSELDRTPRPGGVRTLCRDEGERLDRLVFVKSGRRPHELPPFLRRVQEGPRGESRAAEIDPAAVSGQAALDSIWVTLPGAVPPIAMRRGFFASGISRCRSSGGRTEP